MPNHLKLTLILLAFPVYHYAQSGLEISADFISGYQFNKIEIWNEELSDFSSMGFRAQLGYTYRNDEGSFEGLARLGIKYMEGHGTFGNDEFRTRASKMLIGAGTRYWFNEPLSVQLLVCLENNRDFEDIRFSTSDNIRFGIDFGVNYKVLKKALISVSYSGALYPLQSQYLIFNPRHQFNIGFTYKMF